jgi:proteasome lid subunit RPN8/RPN11
MIGGPLPTPGQTQAISELHGLQRLTDGGIKIAKVHDRDGEDGNLRVDLLVDCVVPPDWRPLRPLQPVEPVYLEVPPAYPLHQPYAYTDDHRFAGLPHVVWGNNICLHLSGNDWDPGRGMAGLVQRLLDWFRQVADGTITAPDLVQEPPLTDTSRAQALLLVRPDLPPDLESDDRPWAAWAVVEAVGDAKYEVREWLTDDDPTPQADADGRTFLVPVLGLPDPVGFSYPQRLGDLLTGIEQQRTDPQRFWASLLTAMELTGRLWSADATPLARPFLFVLLVSPAPGRRTGRARAAYLAAWTVDVPGLAAGDLDLDDPVAWVPVLDQRPRFTTRRDVTRPTAWLHGKRVLLLGCGGLGAPIAEFCVRAGVSELHLLDDGKVLPGILVRQPYQHADIGWPKAHVLRERLAQINPATPISSTYDDAVDVIMRGTDVPEVDLVIDATAARTVAAALERTRWETDRPLPPLLSVVVGHDCSIGAATLALPGATGAGVDILRRLAVTAGDDDELADFLDDFHPDLPRTDLFLPEPGCSDPTYVGSAADLASFSAWLLNDALTILGAEPHEAAPRRWATVVRSPSDGSPQVASQRRHWPEPLLRNDLVHGYQIRLDRSAFADVRREVLRMAGRRSTEVETGGLLLGQLDHASRVVWVTEAQGLPAGSEAAAEGLVLDPRSARAHVDDRLFFTRRLVGFIGAWHTHPRHEARPSTIDDDAMQRMADDNGAPVLLMIFGSDQDGRWQQWLAGRGRPDWYASLYFPA